MGELKLENSANTSSAETRPSSEAISASPTERNRIREEMANANPIQPPPGGPTLSEPQRLMNLYLSGKLSMGQLAFELRKFNSVTADNFIKDGKSSSASQIDYREVPRASIANPGGDLNPDAAKHSPPPSSGSGLGAQQSDDADDEQKKKQEEKEKKQEEKNEKHDSIVRINVFEQEVREIKSSQDWREAIRKERVKEEEAYADKNAAPEEATQSTRLKGSRAGLRVRLNAQEQKKQTEEKVQTGAAKGKR